MTQLPWVIAQRAVGLAAIMALMAASACGAQSARSSAAVSGVGPGKFRRADLAEVVHAVHGDAGREATLVGGGPRGEQPAHGQAEQSDSGGSTSGRPSSQSRTGPITFSQSGRSTRPVTVPGGGLPRAVVVELWRAGKHTSAELAELFSVARSTVYRAVQRAGEPKTARARKA